jgi:hypothetical protein
MPISLHLGGRGRRIESPKLHSENLPQKKKETKTKTWLIELIANAK